MTTIVDVTYIVQLNFGSHLKEVLKNSLFSANQVKIGQTKKVIYLTNCTTIKWTIKKLYFQSEVLTVVFFRRLSMKSFTVLQSLFVV